MTGGRGCHPPTPPISALPHRQPPDGSYCGMFRGEPAIPGLDWTFTPRRGSEERFAHQHPFGPPRGFRPASPCPRLDRPASGRSRVTTGEHTPPLGQRPAGCRFPFGYGVTLLSLATRLHSLARSSKRTQQPRRLGSYSCLAALSFAELTFRATAHYPRPISGSFHPPSRGSFQLSLTVLLRYRTRDVFSLGG